MKKLLKRKPHWARNILILTPFWLLLSLEGYEIWGKTAFGFIFLSFFTLYLMIQLSLILFACKVIEFIIKSELINEKKLIKMHEAFKKSK